MLLQFSTHLRSQRLHINIPKFLFSPSSILSSPFSPYLILTLLQWSTSRRCRPSLKARVLLGLATPGTPPPQHLRGALISSLLRWRSPAASRWRCVRCRENSAPQTQKTGTTCEDSSVKKMSDFWREYCKRHFYVLRTSYSHILFVNIWHFLFTPELFSLCHVSFISLTALFSTSILSPWSLSLSPPLSLSVILSSHLPGISRWFHPTERTLCSCGQKTPPWPSPGTMGSRQALPTFYREWRRRWRACSLAWRWNIWAGSQSRYARIQLCMVLYFKTVSDVLILFLVFLLIKSCLLVFCLYPVVICSICYMLLVQAWFRFQFTTLFFLNGPCWFPLALIERHKCAIKNNDRKALEGWCVVYTVRLSIGSTWSL